MMDHRPSRPTALLGQPPHFALPRTQVRTSGETRLSDFLLWQVAHAHLCYLPTLWPDLSVLDFARCVLSYQRQRPLQEALRQKAAAAVAAAAEAGPGVASTGAGAGAGAGKADGQVGAAATAGGVRMACGEQQEVAAASTAGEQTGLRRRMGSSGPAGPHHVQQAPDNGISLDSAASEMRTSLWALCRRYASLAAPASMPGAKCFSSHGHSASSPEPPRADPHGSSAGSRGVPCAGEGSSGGGLEAAQWRLARFFDRLEKARIAWIASHVDL